MQDDIKNAATPALPQPIGASMKRLLSDKELLMVNGGARRRREAPPSDPTPPGQTG